MKSFDVVAETRRRWTAEERRQIVAESETAPVSVVARRHGVAVSLVSRWRRQAGLPGKRASVKKAGGVVIPPFLEGVTCH
jgi:transposase-like protein